MKMKDTVTNEITVKPVQTSRDRRLFLTFPWRIYKNDPLWIPPLLSTREERINPRINSIIQDGVYELYIARKSSRIAGTICVADDRHTNKALGKKACIFGFFECENDIEVADGLLSKAAEWAITQGLDCLFGPFNLDYEDSYGVLVDGREYPPTIFCGHNPPYYQDFFEHLGFTRARGDNLAYVIDLQGGEERWQRLSHLAERVRRQGKITVRHADITQWQDETARIFELINVCLAHLNDFIPYREETLSSLLQPFRKLADPELILFAEREGKTVGWFPGVPNFNEKLRNLNGLRYPWDYLRLIGNLRRTPDWLAIKSVLVLPQFWGSGVPVLLFDEMVRRARDKGFRWVDLSLTSEDNPNTPILARRLGATIYKRYRTYRKELKKRRY